MKYSYSILYTHEIIGDIAKFQTLILKKTDKRVLMGDCHINYDSVRKEVQGNILIVFCIPMKLLGIMQNSKL